MKLIQQNDTTHPIIFLMVSSNDHISGATGKTVTVVISKNGGLFGSPTGSVSEIGDGWYKFEPDSSDVSILGSLAIHCTAPDCDPTDLEYSVVAFDPYDATRMGLTALPNADAATNGGLPTVDANNAVKLQTGTGANQINLNNGGVMLQATTHTGVVIPTVTAVTNDVGITQSGADKVWSSTTRTLTSFGTLIADIWSHATRTLTAISDVNLADGAITAAKIADGAFTAAKFGAGAFDAVWERATSALTTVGTIGKLLVDNVNATISSRLASAGYTAPDNASITAIKAKTDQLTFASGDVVATLSGEAVTVGTNNDKTGYSLSAAGVQAIWDVLTSALTTANSIGKRLVDNIDAAISSRLATAGYTAPDNAGISSLNTKLTTGRANNLDNLDATVSSRATPAQVNAEADNAIVDARLNELIASPLTTPPAAGSLFGELTEDDGGVQRFTANALEQAPTGGEIAAADVWEYADRSLTDKEGFSLSPAGVLAIWNVLTSALSAAGSIGKRLADNVDAAISSRLATAGYTAPDNASITAIKGKTDQLVFTAGDVKATLDGEQVTVSVNNDKTGYALSGAAIQAIWDVLTSALSTAGSIGKHIVDRLNNVDTTVSSRLAASSYTAPPTPAAIRAEIDSGSTKLDVAVSTRLAAASYTAPDNTGIANLNTKLTAQRAANLDNLDTSVSSRFPASGYTAPDNSGIASLNTKLTTQRAANLDNLDATVSSRSSHSVADIWNALLSGMSVVGSVGKQIADNLNAAITTRLAGSSYVAPDNTGIASLNTKLTSQRAANLDNLDTAVSSRLAAADYTAPDNTAIATIANRIGAFAGTGANTVLGFLRAIMRSDATLPGDVGGTYNPAADSLEAIRNQGDTSWGSVPSAVADAIWDALLANHVDPDTMGAVLNFLYDKVQRVGGISFITAVDPETMTVTVKQGIDYTDDSGYPLVWQTDAYDLTDATIEMSIWFTSSRDLVLSAAGTVVQGSSPAIFKVELTAAQTAALLAGAQYQYDVDATLQNGAKVNLVPPSKFKVIADVR